MHAPLFGCIDRLFRYYANNVLNNEHLDWILEKDARKEEKTIGRKKRTTRTKIECKYVSLDIGSVLKWLVDIHGVFTKIHRNFLCITDWYFLFLCHFSLLVLYFVPLFFFGKVVTRWRWRERERERNFNRMEKKMYANVCKRRDRWISWWLRFMLHLRPC